MKECYVDRTCMRKMAEEYILTDRAGASLQKITQLKQKRHTKRRLFVEMDLRSIDQDEKREQRVFSSFSGLTVKGSGNDRTMTYLREGEYLYKKQCNVMTIIVENQHETDLLYEVQCDVCERKSILFSKKQVVPYVLVVVIVALVMAVVRHENIPLDFLGIFLGEMIGGWLLFSLWTFYMNLRNMSRTDHIYKLLKKRYRNREYAEKECMIMDCVMQYVYEDHGTLTDRILHFDLTDRIEYTEKNDEFSAVLPVCCTVDEDDCIHDVNGTFLVRFDLNCGKMLNRDEAVEISRFEWEEV